MTLEDLKAGIETAKSYWPQWRRRLDEPGAEALIMRFWLRLKEFPLHAFENAIITWVETRNTTPTIQSLVDLTDECHRAWRRGQQMEAMGQNRTSIAPSSGGRRTVEELAWAKFHCEVVERGLNLRTASRAKALAELYLELAGKFPILAESCERESYQAFQIAQELERHPERGFQGHGPKVVSDSLEHADPSSMFTSDESPGQEELL